MQSLTTAFASFGTQLSTTSNSLGKMNDTAKSLHVSNTKLVKETEKQVESLRNRPIGSNKSEADELLSQAFAKQSDEAKLNVEYEKIKKMMGGGESSVFDSTEVSAKTPENKKLIKEHADKLNALIKGQEIIGAQFSNNPYLQRINEIQSDLKKQRDERKSEKILDSIGGGLQNFGKLGGASNPISKMISGLGQTMKSVSTGVGKARDVNSFLFGGGIQARNSLRSLESDRRANVHDAHILNAKKSRTTDINKMVSSSDISDSHRSKLLEELKELKNGKNGITELLNRMESRAKPMADNYVKYHEYAQSKLDPKGYGKYSQDDKKYLSDALHKNVSKSLGVTNTITNNDTHHIPGVLNPNTGKQQGQSKTSLADFARSKNAGRQQNTPKKSLADFARGKGNLGSNVLMSKIRVSSNPSTPLEYIAGIYDQTKINNNLITGLKSSGNGKAPSGSSSGGLLGGLGGLGGLALGVGGAFLAQKVLSGIGIGDGGAGGSVGDDIAMKGGRTALVKGGSAVAKYAAKPMLEGGVKGAMKMGGKFGAKTLAKKIPGVAVGAGLLFGAQRAMHGDILGAGGEVLSGVLSGLVPGFGTAASLLIDTALIGRDLAKNSKKKSDDKSLNVNKPLIGDPTHKPSNQQRQVIPLSANHVRSEYNQAQSIEMQAKLNAHHMLKMELSDDGRAVRREQQVNAAKAIAVETNK